MTMTPNFLKIRQTAQSCMDGILTTAEAMNLITHFMEPDQLIPEEELLSLTEEMKSEHRLATRLERIEQKVDAICALIPEKSPDFPDPTVLGDEAHDLAKAGEKIKAIQIHREKTGCGLAEAKQLIEQVLSDNQ